MIDMDTTVIGFQILFGIFLTTGLYLLTLQICNIPRAMTKRALQQISRSNQWSHWDAYFLRLTRWMANKISIDSYKKKRMEHMLKVATIEKTPEEFVASSIKRCLPTITMGIILFPWIPLGSILFGTVSTLLYLSEWEKVKKKVAKRKENIEGEVPRLVATITQELLHNRDIIRMLERFKTTTTTEFALELDILVADMRSSEYEAALTRFESRFYSTLISDLVRGLIAVLRGDDGGMYFQMLSHDMKQLEIQQLKAKAHKIPPKIRKYSLYLLLCFLITYLVVMGYEIVRSLDALF